QPLGAKETLEPARVDRLVEQTVEILFVITARTRDALGVERFEELVASQTVEVVCVVSEWIEMPDRGAVLRQTRRLDAGNLFQVAAQVVRVLAPARGFLNQLVELLHADDGLELLHPVIAATGEILLCASKAARGTSHVVEGVAPVQEFIAVAGYGAAFATRDMLGILKAETSQITERAALAAFVFGEPGLAGILDHSQLVFARNRVD